MEGRLTRRAVLIGGLVLAAEFATGRFDKGFEERVGRPFGITVVTLPNSEGNPADGTYQLAMKAGALTGGLGDEIIDSYHFINSPNKLNLTIRLAGDKTQSTMQVSVNILGAKNKELSHWSTEIPAEPDHPHGLAMTWKNWKFTNVLWHGQELKVNIE